MFAGPIVAAVAALVAALSRPAVAGIPLRDPGAVTVRRLTVAVAMTVGFLLLDIVVRAAVRDGGIRIPSVQRARRRPPDPGGRRPG